jgi:hypothetical protein
VRLLSAHPDGVLGSRLPALYLLAFRFELRAALDAVAVGTKIHTVLCDAAGVTTEMSGQDRRYFYRPAPSVVPPSLAPSVQHDVSARARAKLQRELLALVAAQQEGVLGSRLPDLYLRRYGSPLRAALDAVSVGTKIHAVLCDVPGLVTEMSGLDRRYFYPASGAGGGAGAGAGGGGSADAGSDAPPSLSLASAAASWSSAASSSDTLVDDVVDIIRAHPHGIKGSLLQITYTQRHGHSIRFVGADGVPRKTKDVLAERPDVLVVPTGGDPVYKPVSAD